MTDEEGVFKLSMSVFELAKEADKAMEELGKEYQYFLETIQL